MLKIGATSAIRNNVEAALAEADPGLATEPFAGASAALLASAQQVLVEGNLDESTGAALLTGLFAQEATGQLYVNKGPAEGTLFFVRGEPVWSIGAWCGSGTDP